MVTGQHQQVTILMVEDDPGHARLIEKNIRRAGVMNEIVHAADGTAALDHLAQAALARDRSFLVLLDLNLPDMSGTAILEHLKSTPALRRFPVIVLTTTDDEREIQRSYDLGANVYITKPVVYVTASDESLVAVSALKAGAADYVLKDAGHSFSELLAAILNQAIRSADLKAAQERARDEIAAARERAEIMLKEVNHRVANSLTLVVSMAHLQASALPQGVARDAVAAFAKRVNAIAQVHKRLYTSEDVRTVALDVYLSELVHNLHDSISDAQTITDIELDCCPLRISTDQAISVGVILSEMITNAGKYAYVGDSKGVVRVQLTHDQAAAQACLTVEDDGVGIADGSPSGTGLGGQIMEALADGLGGELEIRRGASGTRATLCFPVAE